MAYNLEIYQTKSDLEKMNVECKISDARNLSELQKELDSWLSPAWWVTIIKGDHMITEAIGGSIQLFKSTIIN